MVGEVVGVGRPTGDPTVDSEDVWPHDNANTIRRVNRIGPRVGMVLLECLA